MTEDWATALTTKLLDNTPELKQVSLREIMAMALRDERSRCAVIEPRADIEIENDAYSSGYVEGFADAVTRYRAQINPNGNPLNGYKDDQK